MKAFKWTFPNTKTPLTTFVHQPLLQTWDESVARDEIQQVLFVGFTTAFSPKSNLPFFNNISGFCSTSSSECPDLPSCRGESTCSPWRAQRSLQLLNNQKALQITAVPKRRANQISFESYKEKQKLKALILNLKTMHMYEPHWSLNIHIHFVFHPHCLWLQSFAKNITFKHNTSTFWKSPNPLFPSHCLPPPKYTTTNFW